MRGRRGPKHHEARAFCTAQGPPTGPTNTPRLRHRQRAGGPTRSPRPLVLFRHSPTCFFDPRATQFWPFALCFRHFSPCSGPRKRANAGPTILDQFRLPILTNALFIKIEFLPVFSTPVSDDFDNIPCVFDTFCLVRALDFALMRALPVLVNHRSRRHSAQNPPQIRIAPDQSRGNI